MRDVEISSSATPFSLSIRIASFIIPEAIVLASSVVGDSAEAVTEKRRKSGSIITVALPVTDTVAVSSTVAQETARKRARIQTRSLLILPSELQLWMALCVAHEETDGHHHDAVVIDTCAHVPDDILYRYFHDIDSLIGIK